MNYLELMEGEGLGAGGHALGACLTDLKKCWRCWLASVSVGGCLMGVAEEDLGPDCYHRTVGSYQQHAERHLRELEVEK